MKFKFLYSVSAVLFAGLVAMGSSSGPASSGRGDRSGVGANCSSCHSGSNAAATITIQLIDANSNAVVSYMSGQTYTVRVVLTGGTVYGFNSRVISTLSPTDAGIISSPSSNAKITQLGSSKIAEQNAASSSGTFTFQWTAPIAGAGNVRIYAAGIAANGDGNDSNADFSVATNLLISENTGVNVENVSIQSLNIFPNPTAGLLNISSNITEAGDYQLDVVDMAGQIVQQQQQNLQIGAQQIQIGVQNLPTGWYQLRISNGKKQLTQLFNKF